MLLGELDLDGSKVSSTFSKLKGGVAGLSATLATVGAPLLAIGAAIASVVAVAQNFGETLALGGELDDLSVQTGETVGDLVILRTAFDDAGVGGDKTREILQKFQETLAPMNAEAKKTTDTLDALGLKVDDLRDLPAIGQLEKLQNAFAGVADQTTKVAAARALFGDSGGKLLTLLNDTEAFDNARKAAGPLAAIMDANHGAFDKLGDVVGHLKLNFQEFFAGALSKIAPEATSIAEALDSIDFVGIGETVGAITNVFLKMAGVLAQLAPAINAISEGLSSLFGSGSTAEIGLSAKYKGFAKLEREKTGESSAKDSPVSGLQKIGGGGGFGGGDPILSEQRSQTRLLQRIADGVARFPGVGQVTPEPVPV